MQGRKTNIRENQQEHDLEVGAVYNQVIFIYVAHFSQKEIKCGGRKRGDEQRDVRTNGSLLSGKRD